MIRPPHSSSILVLFCLALVVNAALGQSISIVKEGQHEFWIQAAAPPETRYRLQTSEAMHLWVDLHDDVRGQFSYRYNSAGVPKRFFRLTPWTPSELPPITLVMLGDSTVADFAVNLGYFNGWGQGIYGYFKPMVRVVNLASPGFTTRVFLASAEMTQMLVLKPDYVLVQFGLIDEYARPPHNTTLEEYADNLRAIVRIIRDFHGIPILVTPPALRYFDEQDKVIPVYQHRWAVLKGVAAELQTHLIDLNQRSTDLFNQLGKSGSDHIWWGNEWQHFSDKGAQVIAGLVVSGLPDALKAYLVVNDNPPQKP
jgi:lysophospholipase L1-like esterase